MRPRRPEAFLLLFVMMVSLSGASLLAVSGPASAYTPVEVSLEAPSFAGTLEAVKCVLTASGGPAVEYGTNYTFKAEIVADNVTGSSVSPSTGSSASGKFNITVTMPGEAQDIKVKINVTSKAQDSKDNVYKVREFEIKVVSPIVITATVHNTGEVDATDVTATFYADGILLGERVFDVPAGESTELVYNWTWANVADGKHVVTVIVDDEDGLVEFSDGNNVYSMTIYVGSEGNPIGAVLTVGVILMSVLVALMVLAKPQRKK
ncbi:MAG: CARDB domain-containing protein [Thermoplasmata archaeon]